jgi:hypothetical protein
LPIILFVYGMFLIMTTRCSKGRYRWICWVWPRQWRWRMAWRLQQWAEKSQPWKVRKRYRFALCWVQNPVWSHISSKRGFFLSQNLDCLSDILICIGLDNNIDHCIILPLWGAHVFLHFKFFFLAKLHFKWNRILQVGGPLIQVGIFGSQSSRKSRSHNTNFHRTCSSPLATWCCYGGKAAC